MTEKSIALAEYAFSHEVCLVSNALIDITEDLNAGILLSQIIYWFSPDKNGNSKIRVIKKDGMWLAKTREDWYKEVRLSPKQYDRAMKILEKKELVETSLHRFNGSPTIHVRPKWDNYNKAVAEWKKWKAEEIERENAVNSPILPFGEIPDTPNGNLQIDHCGRTITETTALITSNNTNLDNKECISETETHYTDEELSEIEENAGKWKWQSQKQYVDYIEKIMPKYIQEIVHDKYGKDSQVAYNVYLKCIKMFYTKYRMYNGRLHPWYKKETLKSCIDELHSYFMAIYDHVGIDEVTDYMEQFFEHKSMTNKPLAVFCKYKMLRLLEKEITQDWHSD